MQDIFVDVSFDFVLNLHNISLHHTHMLSNRNLSKHTLLSLIFYCSNSVHLSYLFHPHFVILIKHNIQQDFSNACLILKLLLLYQLWYSHLFIQYDLKLSNIIVELVLLVFFCFDTFYSCACGDPCWATAMRCSQPLFPSFFLLPCVL